MVVMPTYASQDVALLPSHTFMVQTLLGSLCEQAGRMPAGGPMIVVHIPGELPALQAWHCPAQALLQQLPSTQ
jgi:hypothetical protein